jgi:Na+-transporting methylmalonyl-CoA/oxaloacetate decarboxylase beta subunit
MSKVSVWKGFAIASLLWILVYLVVGYLVIYFGWDKTIHPLIWLPIAAVIVIVIAIPYLRYIDKKSQ